MAAKAKLDGNWISFQLANSASPEIVTDSAIAPSARIPLNGIDGTTNVNGGGRRIPDTQQNHHPALLFRNVTTQQADYVAPKGPLSCVLVRNAGNSEERVTRTLTKPGKIEVT